MIWRVLTLSSSYPPYLSEQKVGVEVRNGLSLAGTLSQNSLVLKLTTDGHRTKFVGTSFIFTDGTLQFLSAQPAYRTATSTFAEALASLISYNVSKAIGLGKGGRTTKCLLPLISIK
jgi:hypothetical protein